MAAATPQKNLLVRMLDPSFLAGASCTIAFYTVMHQPGMKETTLHHYTTEHAVEYVIVSLFLWGLCDIALRLLSFPKQFFALKQNWLPARQGREPVTNAAALLDLVQRQRPWLQQSRVGQRLIHSLQFVVEEGSAADLRDRLQYLSEEDEDHAHAHYSLARFIAGITPILGFLGTVVHFGTALSGISFDQMSARLPIIVAEMGTAFNTTTVALGASMTMMFAVFVCERIERGLVHSIDHLVNRELLNRFDVHDANIVPFLSAVQSASAQALQAIDATLQRQIVIWSQALEKLFQKFEERQIAEVHAWDEALKLLQKRHEANDAVHEERVRKMLTSVEASQAQHMERIQKSLDKAGSIGKEIGDLTETLQSIARGEGRLSELQGTLSNNLRVIRETQQIDEAMHGLTAAIHLLTARHHKSGNQDSAAAA
ncbi:MotA/TolQ/ExbB proton channel family protein [Planctomicrobium sp. SH661]|uniref:MotA/TolQ/ExbB proton channel family protein n=1 Tax=Planctomicrobium sp. SH661 TaxID=3448124 RepID=UPI003F5C8C0E